MRNHAFLGAVALLAACGGGGGGGGDDGDGGPAPSSACTFVPGRVSWTEVAGNTPQNLERSIDGDLESFASIGSDVCCGQGSIVISDRIDGQQFPAGGRAGLYLSLPEGTTSGNITISTLLDGVVQDTATGPALGDTADPQHSSAGHYLSVATTKTFDEIQLTLSASITGLTGDIQLYEFCADAAE